MDDGEQDAALLKQFAGDSALQGVVAKVLQSDAYKSAPAGPAGRLATKGTLIADAVGKYRGGAVAAVASQQQQQAQPPQRAAPNEAQPSAGASLYMM